MFSDYWISDTLLGVIRIGVLFGRPVSKILAASFDKVFAKKLHKIERNWTEGVCVPDAPLDSLVTRLMFLPLELLI